MAEHKTPTAKSGRGMECFADCSIGPISTIAMQAQILAARFGITPKLAATLASLVFGGAARG